MPTSGQPSGLPSLSYTSSISIVATPRRVLWAFFDPGALASWWQTARSVTVPRVLGAYAVEWEPTEFKDELLGRLGGAFHGTVVDYTPEREFFVADAYWLPPDGSPIGPMALEVTCEPQRTQNPQITLVKVTQRANPDIVRQLADDFTLDISAGLSEHVCRP